MSTLAPSQTIKRDDLRDELYFSIGGFWPHEEMLGFLNDLSRAAGPFIKAKKPFVSIGNFTDFVPQNRETAEAIRDSLLLAAKNGLKRFAVVNAAPLVTLQYRRITKDMDVEFFETESAARAWLHAD
ncbi:hypothetical protein [Erythrobacter sp. YT30]|uniref:hypothetical protein n=1 Tax=Erythrobacter sp. YT30 TaxID=1735012 RepID=UPI00076DB77E|nr:hypothetical protein [Erythrobacter sp. YT30]KWV93351.1 hypothetical protein AUC45_04385 [Erythrobacter sp. YT30]